MSVRLTWRRLASAGLIAASLFTGPWLGISPSAVAQDDSWNMDWDRAVSHVWVARPVWRRGSGLVYGSMTVINENPYPVWKVIVACDFFDQWGNPIGTKATAIHRVFGPGRTRVGGIHFTAITPNSFAGACRVLSAAPWSGPSALSTSVTRRLAKIRRRESH